jgi:hypothetical protein
MRIQLESRVKDWGLQDKSNLIGPRADIPRLIVAPIFFYSLLWQRDLM